MCSKEGVDRVELDPEADHKLDVKLTNFANKQKEPQRNGWIGSLNPQTKDESSRHDMGEENTSERS